MIAYVTELITTATTLPPCAHDRLNPGLGNSAYKNGMDQVMLLTLLFLTTK
jgi:hypothetical protein